MASTPLAVPSVPRTLLLCLAALVPASCATAPANLAPPAPTLAGNPRLPAKAIEPLYSPAKWRKLRDLRYRAYVIFDAHIRSDGSPKILRTREAFPNVTWTAAASNLAANVELHASNLGSHLGQPAEICVIFFEKSLDGQLALVFARQTSAPGPGMTLDTRFY
jgi:hypothetical protein